MTLPRVGDLQALDRSTLDLTQPEMIRSRMREIRPDVVVNAAAYTDVERAEIEQELATQVNAVAPGVIAQEARSLGAAVLHYSTDYVFDGSKRIPYTEEDEPRPLNAYARTKLEGEKAVVAAGGQYAILRISWVYGVTGRSFVAAILRRAQQGSFMRVVDDQTGVPTWSKRIAQVTTEILERLATTPPIVHSLGRFSGIYHCASQGSTTRAEYTEQILRLAGFDPRRFIQRVPTSAYPTAAVRPQYSVLDSHKLLDAFGIIMPHWNEDLETAVPQIRNALQMEEHST
jgi:dTDP-4-dehydrorhamnose reductase